MEIIGRKFVMDDISIATESGPMRLALVRRYPEARSEMVYDFILHALLVEYAGGHEYYWRADYGKVGLNVQFIESKGVVRVWHTTAFDLQRVVDRNGDYVFNDEAIRIGLPDAYRDSKEIKRYHRTMRAATIEIARFLMEINVQSTEEVERLNRKRKERESVLASEIAWARRDFLEAWGEDYELRALDGLDEGQSRSYQERDCPHEGAVAVEGRGWTCTDCDTHLTGD